MVVGAGGGDAGGGEEKGDGECGESENEDCKKKKKKKAKKEEQRLKIFIVTDQGNIFFSDINVHLYWARAHHAQLSMFIGASYGEMKSLKVLQYII